MRWHWKREVEGRRQRKREVDLRDRGVTGRQREKRVSVVNLVNHGGYLRGSVK